MKIKKRYLTLLEILVVFTLLALTIGVLAISGARVVQEQKYRSEVDTFVDHLNLAQDLMLIFNSNVHVKIRLPNEKQGFTYTVEFDSSLPYSWSNELSREHQLTHVHAINFKDELIYPEEKNVMDLKFFSKGYMMSKGVMQLASSKTNHKNTFSRYIPLTGYPGKLKSFSTLEEAEKYQKQQETMNKQITQQTFEEIRAKEEIPPQV